MDAVKYRIGFLTAGVLGFIALAADALQMFLTFLGGALLASPLFILAPVGFVLSFFVSLLAGGVIALILGSSGVPLTKLKNFIPFILEVVPFGNIAPMFTLATFLYITDSWREDKTKHAENQKKKNEAQKAGPQAAPKPPPRPPRAKLPA